MYHEGKQGLSSPVRVEPWFRSPRDQVCSFAFKARTLLKHSHELVDGEELLESIKDVLLRELGTASGHLLEAEKVLGGAWLLKYPVSQPSTFGEHCRAMRRIITRTATVRDPSHMAVRCRVLTPGWYKLEDSRLTPFAKSITKAESVVRALSKTNGYERWRFATILAFVLSSSESGGGSAGSGGVGTETTPLLPSE